MFNTRIIVLSVLLISITFAPIAQSQTQTIFGSDATADPLVEDVLIDIDPFTGAGTIVGGFGFTLVLGLACDVNTNTLYGSDVFSQQLITINQNTGAGALVGPMDIPVSSLAFDPNTNTLYGVDVTADELVTIDTETGEPTSVGPVGFANVLSLAFDSNTNTLYGVNPDLDNNFLVTIDTDTGDGTLVGDITGPGAIVGLTFDAVTNRLLAADVQTGELLSIDTDTAVGTVIGNTGFEDVNGLATCRSGVTNIPTLSEWALIAMAGILGIAGYMVLRRRKVSA